MSTYAQLPKPKVEVSETRHDAPSAPPVQVVPAGIWRVSCSEPSLFGRCAGMSLNPIPSSESKTTYRIAVRGDGGLGVERVASASRVDKSRLDGARTVRTRVEVRGGEGEAPVGGKRSSSAGRHGRRDVSLAARGVFLGPLNVGADWGARYTKNRREGGVGANGRGRREEEERRDDELGEHCSRLRGTK